MLMMMVDTNSATAGTTIMLMAIEWSQLFETLEICDYSLDFS